MRVRRSTSLLMIPRRWVLVLLRLPGILVLLIICELSGWWKGGLLRAMVSWCTRVLLSGRRL